MDALTTLDLAQALRNATGDSFVVIDARNAGGAGRWKPSFPTLDDDSLAKLGDAFVLRFTSRDPHDAMVQAQQCFTTLCRDVSVENDTLLSGEITYVGVDWEYYWKDDACTRTVSFDIGDDDSRPAFDGGKLRHHDIVERM